MICDQYKSEYTTLGIALAGVYATAPNKWSADSACQISIPDRRLSAYLGDLVDGGVVVDKRTCKEEDIIQWVCSGPMLKESLPDSTHENFERQLIHTTLEDILARKIGGFLYIALDLYLALWKYLGARVGRRIGNVIVWEGELFEQPIPPVESRWLVKE